MKKVPPANTKKLLESVSRSAHNHLFGSPAEAYLESRGISKKALSYFRLGFMENPVAEFREFEGMLSIPYIVGEHTVGIKFRHLDDKHSQRYLNNSGFYAKRFFHPQILTGLDSRIYVAEGEIDCITLWQLGVPAVAIPGANAFDPIMGRALRNRDVVVLVDGKGKSDVGKQQGQNLAKQILSSVEEGAKIVLEDSDVNQFYVEHGADKLLREIGWTSVQ